MVTIITPKAQLAISKKESQAATSMSKVGYARLRINIFTVDKGCNVT